MPNRLNPTQQKTTPLAGAIAAIFTVSTIFAVLILVLGCSPLGSLSQRGDETVTAKRVYSPLGAVSMSNDMAALEIAVANLEGQALDQFNEIWRQADIQSLPLETRQQLDRNGIRVGLFGTQLPGELTSALAWSQPLITKDGDILFNSMNPLPATNAGSFAIKQIEQLGSGESHWVPCSPRLPQISWEIDAGDTHRSGICEAAQCGFVVSQIPAGDNAVKLWLRPEIRYGETKMRYGIDQETLLIQEKQKRLRIDELDFPQRIRLGQTLVITTTTSPAGLGQQFFASGGISSSRQVILIRPVRIGRDDLFGPDQTTRRLSTNLD